MVIPQREASLAEGRWIPRLPGGASSQALGTSRDLHGQVWPRHSPGILCQHLAHRGGSPGHAVVGEISVDSLWRRCSQPVFGPPADVGRGSAVRVWPEEELGRRFKWGGHRLIAMHTGARFRPDRCRKADADHVHQHDHSDPNMDDVAAQKHPTQWPQL